MSPDEEAIIEELFVPMRLEAGDYLVEEGRQCRYVAFIEEGLVHYYLNDGDDAKTIYFNKEGEFSSNYQSFLPGDPSNTSIQAIEPCSLRVITRDNLQLLYVSVNEGEKLSRLAIEQEYLNSMRQLKSFYTDTPAQRYQYFLDSFPDLAQRVPQYYIASYVGIKPQSLPRIRKRLSSSNNH